MKWKNWSFTKWVLEAADGEVIDSISRDLFLDDLYVVASTNKRYTSLEAAKKAAMKTRELKGAEDDR